MAVATNTALGTILLAGDLAGSSNANSPQLTPTGVTAGVYKGACVVVDTKGRILHARTVSGYDVGCATTEECGTVTVSDKHHITNTSGKISIKKASKDEYGVVKLGAGFGKDCCEIFVDYVEATPTTLGVVTVPTSGNLVIDVDGSISVPVATTTIAGLVKAVNGNGLTLSGGTLAYTPPEGSGSVKGFVQVGDGFNVAAGQLTVPTATSSVKGLFRFDGNFNFAGNTFSYTTAATASTVGYIKPGSALGVDANGVLSRGSGLATTSSKGVVQVTAANGLAISGGVLSFTKTDATTSALGVVQIGSDIAVSSGTISLNDANSTTTKGMLSVAAGNDRLTITNGLIDFGPGVALKDKANTFTKAQVVSKTTPTYSSTVTLDLSSTNVFDLTLTGSPTIATPTNLIAGGQYILILRQNATGGRIPTFSSYWKFSNGLGQADIGRWIGQSPNAVSVISFTVTDTQIIASVERNFA